MVELKLVEAGVPVRHPSRKFGISEQTFYRWRRKCGGLGARERQKLRQLWEENRRLGAGEISGVGPWSSVWGGISLLAWKPCSAIPSWASASALAQWSPRVPDSPLDAQALAGGGHWLPLLTLS